MTDLALPNGGLYGHIAPEWARKGRGHGGPHQLADEAAAVEEELLHRLAFGALGSDGRVSEPQPRLQGQHSPGPALRRQALQPRAQATSPPPIGSLPVRQNRGPSAARPSAPGTRGPSQPVPHVRASAPSAAGPAVWSPANLAQHVPAPAQLRQPHPHPPASTTALRHAMSLRASPARASAPAPVSIAPSRGDNGPSAGPGPGSRPGGGSSLLRQSGGLSYAILHTNRHGSPPRVQQPTAPREEFFDSLHRGVSPHRLRLLFSPEAAAIRRKAAAAAGGQGSTPAGGWPDGGPGVGDASGALVGGSGGGDGGGRGGRGLHAAHEAGAHVRRGLWPQGQQQPQQQQTQTQQQAYPQQPAAAHRGPGGSRTDGRPQQRLSWAETGGALGPAGAASSALRSSAPALELLRGSAVQVSAGDTRRSVKPSQPADPAQPTPYGATGQPRARSVSPGGAYRRRLAAPAAAHPETVGPAAQAARSGATGGDRDAGHARAAAREHGPQRPQRATAPGSAKRSTQPAAPATADGSAARGALGAAAASGARQPAEPPLQLHPMSPDEAKSDLFISPQAYRDYAAGAPKAAGMTDSPAGAAKAGPPGAREAWASEPSGLAPAGGAGGGDGGEDSYGARSVHDMQQRLASDLAMAAHAVRTSHFIVPPATAVASPPAPLAAQDAAGPPVRLRSPDAFEEGQAPPFALACDMAAALEGGAQPYTLSPAGQAATAPAGAGLQSPPPEDEDDVYDANANGGGAGAQDFWRRGATAPGDYAHPSHGAADPYGLLEDEEFEFYEAIAAAQRPVSAAVARGGGAADSKLEGSGAPWHGGGPATAASELGTGAAAVRSSWPLPAQSAPSPSHSPWPAPSSPPPPAPALALPGAWAASSSPSRHTVSSGGTPLAPWRPPGANAHVHALHGPQAHMRKVYHLSEAGKAAATAAAAAAAAAVAAPQSVSAMAGASQVSFRSAEPSHGGGAVTHASADAGGMSAEALTAAAAAIVANALSSARAANGGMVPGAQATFRTGSAPVLDPAALAEQLSRMDAASLELVRGYASGYIDGRVQALPHSGQIRSQVVKAAVLQLVDDALRAKGAAPGAAPAAAGAAAVEGVQQPSVAHPPSSRPLAAVTGGTRTIAAAAVRGDLPAATDSGHAATAAQPGMPESLAVPAVASQQAPEAAPVHGIATAAVHPAPPCDYGSPAHARALAAAAWAATQSRWTSGPGSSKGSIHAADSSTAAVEESLAAAAAAPPEATPIAHNAGQHSAHPQAVQPAPPEVAATVVSAPPGHKHSGRASSEGEGEGAFPSASWSVRSGLVDGPGVSRLRRQPSLAERVAAHLSGAASPAGSPDGHKSSGGGGSGDGPAGSEGNATATGGRERAPEQGSVAAAVPTAPPLDLPEREAAAAAELVPATEAAPSQSSDLSSWQGHGHGAGPGEGHEHPGMELVSPMPHADQQTTGAGAESAAAATAAAAQPAPSSTELLSHQEGSPALRLPSDSASSSAPPSVDEILPAADGLVAAAAEAPAAAVRTAAEVGSRAATMSPADGSQQRAAHRPVLAASTSLSTASRPASAARKRLERAGSNTAYTGTAAAAAAAGAAARPASGSSTAGLSAASAHGPRPVAQRGPGITLSKPGATAFASPPLSPASLRPAKLQALSSRASGSGSPAGARRATSGGGVQQGLRQDLRQSSLGRSSQSAGGAGLRHELPSTTTNSVDSGASQRPAPGAVPAAAMRSGDGCGQGAETQNLGAEGLLETESLKFVQQLEAAMAETAAIAGARAVVAAATEGDAGRAPGAAPEGEGVEVPAQAVAAAAAPQADARAEVRRWVAADKAAAADVKVHGAPMEPQVPAAAPNAQSEPLEMAADQPVLRPTTYTPPPSSGPQATATAPRRQGEAHDTSANAQRLQQNLGADMPLKQERGGGAVNAIPQPEAVAAEGRTQMLQEHKPEVAPSWLPGGGGAPGAGPGGATSATAEEPREGSGAWPDDSVFSASAEPLPVHGEEGMSAAAARTSVFVLGLDDREAASPGQVADQHRAVAAAVATIVAPPNPVAVKAGAMAPSPVSGDVAEPQPAPPPPEPVPVVRETLTDATPPPALPAPQPRPFASANAQASVMAAMGGPATAAEAVEPATAAEAAEPPPPPPATTPPRRAETFRAPLHPFASSAAQANVASELYHLAPPPVAAEPSSPSSPPPPPQPEDSHQPPHSSLGVHGSDASSAASGAPSTSTASSKPPLLPAPADEAPAPFLPPGLAAGDASPLPAAVLGSGLLGEGAEDAGGSGACDPPAAAADRPAVAEAAATGGASALVGESVQELGLCQSPDAALTSCSPVASPGPAPQRQQLPAAALRACPSPGLRIPEAREEDKGTAPAASAADGSTSSGTGTVAGQDARVEDEDSTEAEQQPATDVTDAGGVESQAVPQAPAEAAHAPPAEPVAPASAGSAPLAAPPSPDRGIGTTTTELSRTTGANTAADIIDAALAAAAAPAATDADVDAEPPCVSSPAPPTSSPSPGGSPGGDAPGASLAPRRSSVGSIASASTDTPPSGASTPNRGRGRDGRGIEPVLSELRAVRAAMAAGDPDGSRCARMSSLLSQLDSYRRGVERRHGPAHALATQLRILHADMSKWLQASVEAMGGAAATVDADAGPAGGDDGVGDGSAVLAGATPRDEDASAHPSPTANAAAAAAAMASYGAPVEITVQEESAAVTLVPAAAAAATDVGAGRGYDGSGAGIASGPPQASAAPQRPPSPPAQHLQQQLLQQQQLAPVSSLRESASSVTTDATFDFGTGFAAAATAAASSRRDSALGGSDGGGFSFPHQQQQLQQQRQQQQQKHQQRAQQSSGNSAGGRSQGSGGLLGVATSTTTPASATPVAGPGMGPAGSAVPPAMPFYGGLGVAPGAGGGVGPFGMMGGGLGMGGMVPSMGMAGLGMPGMGGHFLPAGMGVGMGMAAPGMFAPGYGQMLGPGGVGGGGQMSLMDLANQLNQAMQQQQHHHQAHINGGSSAAGVGAGSSGSVFMPGGLGKPGGAQAAAVNGAVTVPAQSRAPAAPAPERSGSAGAAAARASPVRVASAATEDDGKAGKSKGRSKWGTLFGNGSKK